MRNTALFGLFLLVVLPGCGDKDSTVDEKLQNVTFDVGGIVKYAVDDTVYLAGVTVTLVDTQGVTLSATTTADGLWEIQGVEPGVYVERYELTGYQSFTRQFSLDAFGENDIANRFSSRGTVFLEETGLSAVVSPFALTLFGDDLATDGFAGTTAEYSRAADGAITVTFNKPVVTGTVVLLDVAAGLILFQTSVSADRTVWTLSEVEIDNLGVAGLTADGDPLTFHELSISADTFTDIHGDPITMGALVELNCVL